MKILIIDDDISFCISIKRLLEKYDFVIDCSYDGNSGFSYATSNKYDVIVLDTNLPGMDGNTLCSNIRKTGVDTPILFSSANSDVNTKIRSFNLGCDDYITKPFSKKEFIARLKALSRRKNIYCSDVLVYDDLKIDLSSRDVVRGDKNIYLTKKEFILITLLMKNIGSVVSRDDIFDKVWDMNANPTSNVVEVYINRIRNKIDLPGLKPIINNVLGVGYYIGKRKYFN